MNIFDVAVILLLISGMVVGFKRGFSKELVISVGFILIVILAFILKNPISVFLYEHLPFFRFAGIIKGVTALNIILYEIFAFLIVLSILTIGLKLLIHFTNILEGFLKVTIIFAPLSKIGGMIVGLVESYVWAFIALYFLSIPVLNVPELGNSKFKDPILNNTPILSKLVDNSMNVINDFATIKEKYEVSPNAAEFNKETLDLFLKYDVVSVESVDTLVQKDKLKIDNIDDILNKYRDVK